MEKPGDEPGMDPAEDLTNRVPNFGPWQDDPPDRERPSDDETLRIARDLSAALGGTWRTAGTDGIISSDDPC